MTAPADDIVERMTVAWRECCAPGTTTPLLIYCDAAFYHAYHRATVAHLIRQHKAKIHRKRWKAMG